MTGRFNCALNVVLKHEGGWSNHAADPGGATMRGITLKTFRQYFPDATEDDLRSISDEMVARIYRTDYWNASRCDEWPWSVALAVFDTAVNCGPGRAKRWLQKAAGVTPDKILGPITARAVLAGDPVRLSSEVLAHRLGFYMTLGTNEAFGLGWARRVLDIQREALR